MTTYLIGRGSAPTAQGQAAFVKSRVSPGMIAEIREAVQDARLVGWDLSELTNLDYAVLEQIDRLAQKCDTLVVVVAAPPEIERQFLDRPLGHVVLG